MTGPPDGGINAVAAERHSRIASLRIFLADALRRGGSFGYGFVAQSCSSATSFGLAVVAARALGPKGLGTIYVGFAAYFVLLSLERGLVSDPLIASSAASDPAARAATARFSLTLSLPVAVAGGAALALIGVAIPVPLGRGILVFAPWLAPALIEDLGRTILFRDGRGRSACLADATWLLTLVATAPIVLTIRTDWAVSSCWGLGAVAGAVVALGQIRWRPGQFKDAFVWWKSEAWPYGRWLLMGGMLYNVASYSSVLALAGILGTIDYGGFRAVQSVFAPLTLIAPAIALPGLPIVSRALAISAQRALAIATQLAGVITLVTCAYIVTLYAFPNVLTLVFGHEFAAFQSIVVPIGITQLLMAPGFGLMLFLRAQMRGRTILWLGTLNVLLFVMFSIAFASFFGLKGAAWAGVPAATLAVIALVVALYQTIKTPQHE